MFWLHLLPAPPSPAAPGRAAAPHPQQDLHREALHLAWTGHAAQALDHLRPLGPTSTGQHEDDLHLLRAALHLTLGHAGRATDDLLHLEPLLTRPEQCAAQCLLLAHAHLHQGHTAAAAAALARAERHVTRLPGTPWRAAATCLRAHLLDRTDETDLALRHLHAGLRRASGDVARHLTHHTLAELHPDPFEQRRHAVHARHHARGHSCPPTLTLPPTARPAQDTPVSRHVHLQVLGQPAIHVGGTVIDCAHAPRLPLLLSYVLAHAGESVERAACDLLPSTGGRGVRHHDAFHQAARIRRDVSRVRALLGDPDVIRCRQGVLTLHPAYTWSSDLLDAARTGAPPAHVPRELRCEWTDQFREGTGAGELSAP